MLRVLFVEDRDDDGELRAQLGMDWATTVWQQRLHRPAGEFTVAVCEDNARPVNCLHDAAPSVSQTTMASGALAT